MSKGHAIGFLLVLLVIILGLYVAFTGFMSSRQALREQPTLPPETAISQSTRRPTPTVTPALILPTPIPSETLTPTMTVPISATGSPPSQPTAPPPTEPPQARPTDTPASPAEPPTPVPAPAYQFRLAGPAAPDPNHAICCYILGTIRDAAGNGLEGVQVQAFNEWNTLPPAATKGGGEAGQYNIPIGRDAVTWYVVVVDANGNPISTQVPVPFDPNIANGFRVNWQRTY
jgi:hypothetical protein